MFTLFLLLSCTWNYVFLPQNYGAMQTLPCKIMDQCRLCPTTLWMNADFAPQNHRHIVSVDKKTTKSILKQHGETWLYRTHLNDFFVKIPFFPLFCCSFVPLFLYTFVPLFLCSFVPLFLCFFVSLFLSSFVPLFLCSFAPLFLCCPFVPLFLCCPFVPLFLSFVPRGRVGFLS